MYNVVQPFSIYHAYIHNRSWVPTIFSEWNELGACIHTCHAHCTSSNNISGWDIRLAVELSKLNCHCRLVGLSVCLEHSTCTQVCLFPPEAVIIVLLPWDLYSAVLLHLSGVSIAYYTCVHEQAHVHTYTCPLHVHTCVHLWSLRNSVAIFYNTSTWKHSSTKRLGQKVQ